MITLAVTGLMFSIQSGVVDVNLFEEEMGWKGVAGGDVRLVKAIVFWVMVVCLPTHFLYSPH